MLVDLLSPGLGVFHRGRVDSPGADSSGPILEDILLANFLHAGTLGCEDETSSGPMFVDLLLTALGEP